MKMMNAPKINAAEKMHLGDEFLWDDNLFRDEREIAMKVAGCLQWYRQHCSIEHARNWLGCYLEKINKLDIDLNMVHESQDNLQLGFLCRIVLLGGELSGKTKASFDERISGIINRVKYVKPKNDALAARGSAIHDAIAAKASDMIGELEETLDRFHKNNFKLEFIPYDWLLSHGAKSVHARKIAEWFQHQIDELNLIGIEEDVTEAYQVYSKLQIKAWKAFLFSIVNDCAKLKENAAVTRKPRKERKGKKVKDTLAKLKYKKRDDAFKIVSVDPIKITGASSIWTFETKYRVLRVLNAASDKGLSIKGTTIYGWNEKNSVCKKLRKPETILSSFNDLGKVALKNLMETIKTKESLLHGRMNEECVILKVVK